MCVCVCFAHVCAFESAIIIIISHVSNLSKENSSIVFHYGLSLMEKLLFLR